jgi:predicted aldo/keto reductase-like oxidoreductase
MQYRRLGKTGLEVSVIGFGGFPLMGLPPAEARIFLVSALARGITFFDTGADCGDGESRVGAAFEDLRDRVVVSTKSAALTARDAQAHVLRACQRLKVDAIDLFQIQGVHRPARLEAVLEPDGALDGLRAQRDAGRVKHIGIAGHHPAVLRAAIERTPDFETVQFPFNVLEDGPETRALLSAAAARDVGTIAMKPLAGGILPLPRLALRWVASQPVSTVVTGMASADELEADAAVGDAPAPLTPAEESHLRRHLEPLLAEFCTRCMACEPCPQGIPIYRILELGKKATLPQVAALARDIYDALEVRAEACAECTECEDRCPRRLPIREMLQRAHERLTE